MIRKSNSIVSYLLTMGLPGAVGSGATFALEDGWILARALEYTQTSENAIKDALQIYNEIKNPFYFKM
jgi:salicylate hydroxylase